MKELLRAARAFRNASLEFSITAEQLNYSLKKLALSEKLLIQKQTGVYPKDD